ncbi:MAG TPA: lysophospholipid acyltransferase family protein [Xanthobacteraceae bacterium]|nr:lysophospholipid acyltransferase family protein [Xanthobacteraceae bacterium]
MSQTASPSVWEPPAPLQLARWPLPHRGALERVVVRALALLARRQVLTVHGLEHVQAARDPFILALNHSTMIESLIVPALLVLSRDGRLIHFLADWNYRLIPGVGLLYERGGTITVTRKPARPRILNALKPLYLHPLSALDRARLHLATGHSVGIFPEGKINRDPSRLLPAHHGAALLSLESRIPVVPAGISFPDSAPGRPIRDSALMQVRIGAPLLAPPCGARASRASLHAWHATIMGAIGELCGKAYQPGEAR